MNAKYYVLAKSLWQGDKWSAIAGPFTNKKEADVIASEKASNGFNEYGQQNLSHVLDTVVVNTTAMRTQYKINKYQALENIAYVQETEEMYAQMEEFDTNFEG